MENNNTLPHDMIIEIFLRTSVKNLIQFKCVCKSWFSKISNPNFAKLHFEKALAPSSNRLIYVENDGYSINSIPRSIDLESSINKDYSVVPPKVQIGNIGSSCHGFLFLRDANGFNDYGRSLWNPSTGTHQIIPRPHNLYNKIASWRGTCYAQLEGFGYDEARDDYLVVLACYKELEEKMAFFMEVFSVRTNSWEQLEDVVTIPFPKCSYPNQRCGLYFNGVIHWIMDGSKVIVCFDLQKRKFSSNIDIPHALFRPEYSVKYYDIMFLIVIRGFLGVTNNTEICVMKEYKVESSWTKYCDIGKYYIDYTVEQCPNNGEIIGYFNQEGEEEFLELVRYNHKGEQLENRKFYGDYDVFFFPGGGYRESLLSLPWNMGIN